jgi:hypothetical protein
MKVWGSLYQEFELSEREIDRIVADKLHRLIKVVPDSDSWYTIENDKLVHHFEVGGGSHSWDDQEILRDATELDKAVLTVLKKLK